jgi:hypothetical protein
MTEHTAWADLPNAKYIDLVIASMNKNTAVWSAAWATARDAARGAAWATARDAARGAAWDAASTAARGAARDAAWDAARGAARDAAWDAAWDAAQDAALAAAQDAALAAASGAALALIAWDDYGYLLDEKPENVKMLALLGNHAAVLLYPACVALQNTKELEMA